MPFSILFLSNPSISPFLMIVFTIISVIWIWAVIELNKEYKIACDSKEGEESIF